MPDSRAHGRSTDSEKPLSIELLTDNAIELLDLLGIDAASVVGWSDGGVIGLDMAMRYPDRLHRLIAYGANYHTDGLPDGAIEWANQLSPGTFHPKIANLVYLDIAPEPENFGKMIEKVVAMWLSEPNWSADDLSLIRNPVLIIEDRIGLAIKPDHTYSMVRAIPGAQLALVDGTNHQAPQEQTEDFVRLVKNFLTSDRRFGDFFQMPASKTEPTTNASVSFANAINGREIEVAMSHWSDDALMYFQSGNAETAIISRQKIRQNYEHMFENENSQTLEIRVDGLERVGDIAHEWGSFKVGNSTGCYVLVRRAIDDWKIYREWILEPCGQ